MNKTRRKAIAAALIPLNTIDLTEEGGHDVADVHLIVEGVVSALNDIRDEEQGAFDNLSEGFQQGEQGQKMEENIQQMEEAIGLLEGCDVTAENENWRDELTDELESATEILEAL